LAVACLGDVGFSGLGAAFRADAVRAAGFFAAIFFAAGVLVPIARSRAEPRAVGVRVRAATLVSPPRPVFTLTVRAGAVFARAFAATLVRGAAERAGFAFTAFAVADRDVFTDPFAAFPAFRAIAATVGRRGGLLRWVDAMGTTLVTVEAW